MNSIKLGTTLLDILSYAPYFRGKGKLALWTIRLMGRDKQLTMRLPNNSRIWLGNDNASDMILPYCIGKYEREFTQLFLQHLNQLPSGCSIVDVGANVGYYAIMAAWRLRQIGDGVVFAFEPNPYAYACLRGNQELNGLSNLVAAQKAVSDHVGKMKLFVNPGGNTFSSLKPYLSHLTEVYDVDVVALDRYLSGYPNAKIGLMKIDIEGAELLALQGAQATIEKDRPVIFYEENETACRSFGYTSSDLRKFLQRLDYRFYFMRPTDVQNVIALPKE